jgi:hypothetical protein
MKINTEHDTFDALCPEKLKVGQKFFIYNTRDGLIEYKIIGINQKLQKILATDINSEIYCWDTSSPMWVKNT